METILLADDEPSLRSVYTDIIRDTFPTCEVEVFSDGISLEERLNRDVSDIRLVLTDNTMNPGLTGSELIKKYARTPRFEKISFVLSYGGDEEIGKESVKNGAFGFILKPFRCSELVSFLQQAYSKYR